MYPVCILFLPLYPVCILFKYPCILYVSVPGVAEQIPSEFLIYVMERPGVIKGVPLSEADGKEVMIPVTGLVRPTAVDYHASTGFVVYSDVQR